jgi:hypothetical protein
MSMQSADDLPLSEVTGTHTVASGSIMKATNGGKGTLLNPQRFKISGQQLGTRRV